MKLEFESNTSTLPFAVNNYPTAADSQSATANVKQMLQAGIAAAQTGNRNEARHLLIQVTELEPQNETAWLWMASISEYPEELIIFLNNVLSINPQNSRAIEWMKATKALLAKTFVQRGVESAKAGNKNFAKQCFLQAIVHDNQIEESWYALAEITDSIEEKISHLQKVLNLNAENSAAQRLLQTTKQQAADSILQKANRAAISGETEAARELLAEAFKYTPEREEAWILKSYLADSFSEKVTCFEKVLTLNPENETAISGLASLRALMVKTEERKTQPSATVIEFDAFKEKREEMAVSEASAMPEDFAFNEMEAFADRQTEELNFPPDFLPADLYQEASPADSMSINDTVCFSIFDESEPKETTAEIEQNFDQSGFNQEFSGEAALPSVDFNEEIPVNSEVETRSEMTAVTSESAPTPTETEQSSNEFATSAPIEDSPVSVPSIENSPAPVAPVNCATEINGCPFCNAENEIHAVVCSSCRVVLTLSDLEMMFAHHEIDRETLRLAVERMEEEKNLRPFSSGEYKNLAIGLINLKNLRQGAIYLQKASQMNPNDVMLASHLNLLRIRLAEIEQQESAHNHSIKGRKILIVDDSATVRKLISSKLEKSGHEVHAAVDGADALEKIQEFVPDLVLLDIMMPQIDGYQVCKIIRTNELTKDVPIVMISGKDGFFDKVRGRMAGATGYITKPFGPETLMKTVETYIVHKAEEDQLPLEEEIEVNG